MKSVAARARTTVCLSRGRARITSLATCRAFTLFATHYFELTSLAQDLDNCANVHLDATEHGEKLIFLHTVKDGPANQSYGLQVAALAGVPPKVINAARKYLHELERHSAQPRRRVKPQGELLLEFLEDEEEDEHQAVAALRSVDPDSMTPREALDALYRLKKLAGGKLA